MTGGMQITIQHWHTHLRSFILYHVTCYTEERSYTMHMDYKHFYFIPDLIRINCGLKEVKEKEKKKRTHENYLFRDFPSSQHFKSCSKFKFPYDLLGHSSNESNRKTQVNIKRMIETIWIRNWIKSHNVHKDNSWSPFFFL